MGYAITDGNVFLTQQMKLTKEVYQWKKEKSAKAVFNSWKNSKKRTCSADGFKVIKIISDMNIQSSDDIDRNISEYNTDHIMPEDIHDDDCMKLFNLADNVIQRIKKRSEYLTIKLTEIEHEINDINHYIELAPAQNAPNGYKLYKMLRDRLLLRRYCKDELILLGTAFAEGWDGNFYDMIQKQNNEFKDRKYRPRSHGEISNLFENL